MGSGTKGTGDNRRHGAVRSDPSQPQWERRKATWQIHSSIARPRPSPRAHTIHSAPRSRADGVNFAVYSTAARRTSSCCCSTSRTADPTDVIRLPERDKFIWHALRQGPEARTAVRLQGPRRVPAGVGPALQRRQTAARPLRQGRHRKVPQHRQPAARLRPPARRGESVLDRARQHDHRSQVDRRRRCASTGRGRRHPIWRSSSW